MLCRAYDWGGMEMNDKFVQRAVECYIEKLEEENKALKAIIRSIDDAFKIKVFNGKSRTTNEIIEDIIDILRVHHDIFKED